MSGRIVVAAFGTRGDVQPSVVLARALLDRGHDVAMFVPPNLAPFAREHGVQATPVGIDYSEFVKASSEARLLDLWRLAPTLRHDVQIQFEAMKDAASRAQLVLASGTCAVGAILSRLFEVPYRMLLLSPLLFPARDHPAPFIVGQRWPRWFNAVSWRVNDWAWGFHMRRPVNVLRQALGLATVRRIWPTFMGDGVLLAADRTLFPAPASPLLDRPIVSTGAIALQDPAPLSPALDAFLSAGEKPVYIGFGSMGDPRPQRTVERLLAASRRAGLRAVISKGWAGFDAAPTADAIFVGPEPHAKLFPRCSVVMHHGGAGTTHAAARAGVPQIVVPHLLDQFYSAHRIAALGLGAFLMDRHRLTADRVAAALTSVASSRQIATTAATFGAQMIDGLAATVSAVERELP